MVKIWSRIILGFSRLMGMVVMVVVAPFADASPLPASLSSCGTAKIAAVSDGETLHQSNGAIIRLAAIKAPELWPAGAAYASWPHASWARNTLERLVVGKTVQLFCEGETSNFNDERIAHIQLPGGEWLQLILLERGAAFVFPRRDHISGLPALYAAEDKARQESIGVWQSNKIIQASDADAIRTGWFQVVRGRVLNAAQVRRQTFLNFGTDWRKDFTIEIPASAQRAFKKAQIDPLTFQGQQVEVRGWVTWKGGPHIMLEGPGQIRLINP